ncbi:hypothetical protein [Microbacterium sp. 2FI]|uniref:hypothetical protein n=1 Tax=Microbacterium sp. 2FI TaxID=2502193 RepID=UPI0010F8E5F8|nr:hypothetical protein [Microbacterium sp. 2FI]
MRVLTVRQPWAWAIFHGKDVENRVRNIAGSYRGPVAIQAGLTYDLSWSSRAMDDAMIASGARLRQASLPWMTGFGAIIGVVDLVDVHHCFNALTNFEGCSPWAELDAWHLRLENPRSLADPIPYKGALGLRTLDEATAMRIWEAIA